MIDERAIIFWCAITMLALTGAIFALVTQVDALLWCSTGVLAVGLYGWLRSTGYDA